MYRSSNVLGPPSFYEIQECLIFNAWHSVKMKKKKKKKTVL